MRLNFCRVSNFGSYKELGLDLRASNLTLVYGGTGSGKSTLMDIPCWCLFGVTAKGGAADAVIPWQATGPTVGELEVTLADGTEIVVVRKRNPNDLYFSDGTGITRGKDLKETQTLLDARLGITADSYFSSTYYHEFSEAAHFFTAPAKSRREFFKRISRTRLADVLEIRAKARSKEMRTAAATAEARRSSLSYGIARTNASRSVQITKSGEWDQYQARKLQQIKEKEQNFHQEKAQKLKEAIQAFDYFEVERSKNSHALADEIKAQEAAVAATPDTAKVLESLKGHERCTTCGAPSQVTRDATAAAQREAVHYAYAEQQLKLLHSALRREQMTLNPHQVLVRSLSSAENTYTAQYEEQEKEVNPYRTMLEDSARSLAEDNLKLNQVNEELSTIEIELRIVNELTELSSVLRATLLQRTVQEIQQEANRILETYFDGEMRLQLTATEDDLDIAIDKSGHACQYTQLSKGQRGILKLSFAVAVMQASANAAGIHAETLFLDEALDGLDTDFKIKAHRLFEELATKHASVFVIDHSPEFQNMFERKFHVSLTGDVSHLVEQRAV